MIRSLRRRWVFCALVLCLLVFPGGDLNAQLLPFKPVTIRDGLISNIVTCLCQDSRGYIWVGTADGLSITDGVRFSNYTVKNGLPFDYIYSITESKKSPGVVWIGTGDGISVSDHGNFRTMHTGEASERDIVLSIIEDHAGTIWCGTYNGLYLLEGNSFVPFHHEQFKDACFELVETKDGILWFSSRDGIYEVQVPDGIIKPFLDAALPKTGSANLFIDSGGDLWALFATGTLARIRNRQILSTIRKPLSRPVSIGEDAQGNLIISDWDLGILELPRNHADSSGIERLSSDQSPGANPPVLALTDREGNLWFIDPAGGLLKLADQGIVTFPLMMDAFFLNNCLGAVDRSGHLWVPDGHRLFEIWRGREGAWHEHIHTPLPPVDAPQAVVFDRAGELWVRGLSNKLIHFHIRAKSGDNSGLTVVSTLKPVIDFPLPEITCYAFDRDNNLWLTQGTKLVRIHPSRPSDRLVIDSTWGLTDEGYRALFADHVGTLWIGGNSKELGFLSHDSIFTGHIRTFHTTDGLADNFIRAIAQDSGGTIWIGTRFSGLSLYNKGSFNTINSSSGLLNDAIWGIAPIGPGSAWVATNGGVQLVRIPDKSGEPPKFETVTEMNGRQILSIGTLPGGFVWSITRSGITLLDPAKLNAAALPPSVYIEEALVENKPVNIDASLEFPYLTHNFSIKYTGICFRDPQGLRFQYRMNGGDWSQPATERSISFLSLPAGAYTFEVRSSSAAGGFSMNTARLSFTITAPFWQRWWFRSVLFILAVALAASFVRFLELRRIRKRQQKLEREYALEMERQKTRDKIARDLHDEISATLSGINYFAQVIDNDTSNGLSEGGKKFLSLIRESAGTVQESMSDIIWSINPEHDSWETILSKFRRFASDLFDSKHIQYEISLPDTSQTNMISQITMDQRRQLWLIFKEIITNIAKHSGCSSADITLRIPDPKTLMLEIRDNGQGFDPGKQTDRNGLKNINVRARALGATATVTSSPEEGTTWSITWVMQ